MDQDKPPLHDTLERLHDELEHARTIDPESRQLLLHLQGDIQALLREPGAASSASLRARLDTAVARLEDSYPDLTLALKEVLDHLAEV